MDTLLYRQPRLVILALLVILSAGLSSLVSIGRQDDPTITNIFATITTVFPGADPARVEALVTAKIKTDVAHHPRDRRTRFHLGDRDFGDLGRTG
jgi:multidrug efflux pump subunit AcrB